MGQGVTVSGREDTEIDIPMRGKPRTLDETIVKVKEKRGRWGKEGEMKDFWARVNNLYFCGL